jgi:hypothetical protein
MASPRSEVLFAFRTYDDDILAAADNSAHFFVIVSCNRKTERSQSSEFPLFMVPSGYRLIGISLATLT